MQHAEVLRVIDTQTRSAEGAKRLRLIPVEHRPPGL